MLNICLVFTKVAKLNQPSLCWTSTECQVIQACFETYEFLAEGELMQYGLASHVARVLEKIVSQIETKAGSIENPPVNMVTNLQLSHALNSCVIWLYNLILERSSRIEVSNLRLFDKIM